MAIDIQTARQTGEWLNAQTDGGSVQPGDYVLQAKNGLVDYHIDNAPPADGKSVVTLVPLERVPVRIEAGQVLRYRMFSKDAQLHILE
ncbi:MAG: hypothetical protein AAGI09_02985 [Pseudomonadota bacterium]